MRPLVAPLAGYLDNLYTEASSGDPAKTTILEVLALLVTAAKHYSSGILTITMPLIISTTCYKQKPKEQYYSISNFSFTMNANTNTATNTNICTCSSNSTTKCNFCCSNTKTTTSSSTTGCSSIDQGYLVQDGLALWLAVMRNLTESQYVQYHEDLRQLFLTIYTNLGFYNTNNNNATTTSTTTANTTTTSTVYDIICSDTERNAITKDLLLILEAYALLGGEGYSILHSPQCQAAIAQFYTYCLPANTTIDTSLSSYIIRPLQGFLFSCPVLTTNYLQQAGTLTEILRSCYASVACTNLSKIYAPHQQKQLTITYYLTFLSQILLLNPDLLYLILTQLKNEILTYILQVSGACNQCILTETILLSELINLMFQLYEQLEYIPAPNFHKKLWNLALLSLFPPTIVDNMAVVPPYLPNTTPHNRKYNTTTSNSSTTGSSKQRPDCMMGRTMLMIMNTMNFTIGRAKLEQYQYDFCKSHNSNTTSTTVDYYSLCYWFPSTLTTEHLYNWVAPLVRTCRESLKFERTEQYKAIIQYELHRLIHRDYEETENFSGFSTDSSSNRNSSGSSNSKNNDENSNIIHTIDQDIDITTTTTTTDTMTNTITIQDGDQLLLDCTIEPIVQLYYNRIKQSGILNATLHAHLTEKFSQLCRTLGEELFSQLECIAELDL